ncbi:MAG: sigma-70 family RNA polymerase sigma factor [Anaerolineaceae bacterium]|nr:sigma-70 family RNA polymerase sigma factor [Anaerolineaceae bacterium]
MNPSDLRKESEARLILRAQDGDREAYGELVMRHHKAIFTSLYHLSGDRDLAEDATQQAFIKAWKYLPGYQPRSSLRSWLSRIAVNACLDGLRREKRVLPDDSTLLNLADSQPGPEKALIMKQQTEEVQEAIMELNETSRAALVLREYGCFSYQEIASALGIPLGTVMSRLNHARNQLRSNLAGLLVEMEVDNG